MPISNISTHNKKIQFSPKSKNISEKFFCSTPLFFCLVSIRILTMVIFRLLLLDSVMFVRCFGVYFGSFTFVASRSYFELFTSILLYPKLECYLFDLYYEVWIHILLYERWMCQDDFQTRYRRPKPSSIVRRWYLLIVVH